MFDAATEREFQRSDETNSETVLASQLRSEIADAPFAWVEIRERCQAFAAQVTEITQPFVALEFDFSAPRLTRAAIEAHIVDIVMDALREQLSAQAYRAVDA
jgi:hypothetical protein